MNRYISRILRSILKKDREYEQIEDILKAVYHAETESRDIDIKSLCLIAQIKDEAFPHLLQRMIDEGYISKNEYRLTEKGKKEALHIIRRHRLYETYLSKHSGYDYDKWHQIAEINEHKLTEEDTDRLNSMLGNPLYDPHGDPIPRKDAKEMPIKVKKEEYKMCVGHWVAVRHIEDDDQERFSILTKMGIAKGVVFLIETINPLFVEVFMCGEKLRLRRDLLSLIDLELASSKEIDKYGGRDTTRLSSLKDNEKAMVKSISTLCTGAARRRLMDLGFVSGSEVSVDLHSPMGNPTAYLVRGTAIALREDQANYVLIKKI